MKRKLDMLNTALALFIAAAAAPALASSITIQTGFSDAAPQSSADAYRSTVDAAVATPAPGYGTTTVAEYNNIANHLLFPGGLTTNRAFKSTVVFGVTPSAAGAWRILAGVDFGHGGAVFLDGTALDFRSTDMWWNGSYSNPSQSFQLALNLAAGEHTLQLYGLEGCCDGPQQTVFSIGGSDFHTFGNHDGLLPAVPEPSRYAMLIGGLALLEWRRRAQSGRRLPPQRPELPGRRK